MLQIPERDREIPERVQIRHERRHVNGIDLNCVIAGHGPLVVLLHGFPEFSYSWRYQLPALAAAGFRVVAPDMRGYNLSSKPRRVKDYALATLIEDVVQLVHAFDEERAHIVGHDWGGAIAWSLARQRPDVVRTLQVLNCPHPRLFTQHLLTNPRQLLRSWYIFFFQLPLLPELALRADTYRALARSIPKTAVHPERWSEADIEAYRQAAAQPGALRAAINYYRAAARPQGQRLLAASDPVVRVPVQLIWGEQDFALGKELNDGLERYVPDLRVHFIPDASHWIQQDVPERVNALMLAFLRNNVG